MAIESGVRSVPALPPGSANSFLREEQEVCLIITEVSAFQA